MVDRRLAKAARELKIRNRALLRGGAGASTGGDGCVRSTSLIGFIADCYHLLVPFPRMKSSVPLPPSPPPSSPNPLLAHLDAQLTHLRTELSTLYRTQAAAQNKQLSLSDALRDRDEEVRGLREEVRDLRDARDGLQRRERDWDERWKMRTKDMEVRPIPWLVLTGVDAKRRAHVAKHRDLGVDTAVYGVAGGQRGATAEMVG